MISLFGQVKWMLLYQIKGGIMQMRINYANEFMQMKFIYVNEV